MGGKGPRRRVGPEERRLWERVVASARPLDERRRAEPAPDTPALTLTSSVASPVARPPGSRGTGTASGVPATIASEASPPRPAAPSWARNGTSLSLAPPDAAPVGRPQAGLDRRTAERLRKGARTPDARIDLHGMTAERAHRTCLGFLADAVRRGDRVVLVITGKGRRVGENGPHNGAGRGVLRDSLPSWLRASPLGQSIIGIYQAHRRHGGEGAFYVYLKRHR